MGGHRIRQEFSRREKKDFARLLALHIGVINCNLEVNRDAVCVYVISESVFCVVGKFLSDFGDDAAANWAIPAGPN